MIEPRVIRLKGAATYLGMDKKRFNAEVRPYVTEIPIGSHGKGFDSLDLDAWLDEKACPALSIVEGRSTSTKSSEADAFAKALEWATKKSPALVILKKKPRLAMVC